MNSSDLDRAIRVLCDRFEWHQRVEIFIVGGAAGMLTGVLARDRVTTDCDVILYDPSSALVGVETLAGIIATELQLPPEWLNSVIALRQDILPDGWGDRRILIEKGAFLHVYAASRPDLIAMKFLAGRPQDLEDLEALGVGSDDIIFVRSYLTALPGKGTPGDAIAQALELLNSWPLRK